MTDDSDDSDEPQHVFVRTVWNGAMDVWIYEDLDGESDGKMVLVFETAHGARRATEYPDNWRDMTDAELMDLSACWD
jgi:hypothetical protein